MTISPCSLHFSTTSLRVTFLTMALNKAVLQLGSGRLLQLGDIVEVRFEGRLHGQNAICDRSKSAGAAGGGEVLTVGSERLPEGEREEVDWSSSMLKEKEHAGKVIAVPCQPVLSWRIIVARAQKDAWTKLS